MQESPYGKSDGHYSPYTTFGLGMDDDDLIPLLDD